MRAPDIGFRSNASTYRSTSVHVTVGYGTGRVSSEHALHPQSSVVLAIRSTMTWWVVSGLPRQFIVIWLP